MLEFSILLQRLAAPVVCWFGAVLIHEAGHALAGGLVGRKPVRILIGLEGRLRWVATFFNIPIIIRGWPWGGFVFFGNFGNRLQEIWIVLAGPLAGMAAAAGAILLDTALGGPAFSLGQTKPAGIWQTWFVIMNTWAGLSSLWPRQWSTKNDGILSSDGLLLIQQFRPGWIPRVRRRENGGSMLLITLTFMAGIGCLVAAAIAGAVAWYEPKGPMRWVLPGVTLFFLGLSLWTLGMARREFRLTRKARRKATTPHPDSPDQLSRDGPSGEKKPDLPDGVQDPPHPDLLQAVAALQAADWSAAMVLIDRHRSATPSNVAWASLDLHYRMAIGDHAQGLAVCREIVASIDDAGMLQAAAVEEIDCLSALGRDAETGKAIELLTTRFQDEAAILVLDRIATRAVIRRHAAVCAACLPLLRRFCDDRRELISLRGTLGGVLAELGQSDEARPILQTVLKTSQSLADLGITSLILAELAFRAGQTTEAIGLARRAMALYDEEWVSTRAGTLLSQLLPC